MDAKASAMNEAERTHNPYATPGWEAETESADYVECLSCGCESIRLGSDQVCPHCGTAVTLEVYASLLRFAAGPWVEKLHKGTQLILIATVVEVAMGFMLERMRLPDALAEFVELIPAAIALIGFWWFTTPDPRAPGGEMNLSPRRLTRAIAVVSAAGAVVWAITAAVGELPRAIVVMVFALNVVQILAGGHYACQLALRIPRRKLILQTKIGMWGTALGVGMMAVCLSVFDLESVTVADDFNLIGALMFLASLAVLISLGLWTLIVINKYQTAFKLAAEQAAAFAAADS